MRRSIIARALNAFVTRQPSKNTKCPCGSGKKYWKCCGQRRASRPDVNKIRKIFQKKEQERQAFTDSYGHARPPTSAKLGHSVYTILDGSIFKQTREGLYTFLHAIHDHALLFFGTEYLENEEAKPFEQRHPAIQWMHTFVEHTQRLEHAHIDENRNFHIGAGAAWYRFAYDLFTIRDNARVESRLKERLLANKDFQSARYELWVAALCIAADFALEFEDETNTFSKHPEFIAIDRQSPARIAVEAKSRHRRGVKGFSGGSEVKPGEKVDIRNLVVDAYKKSTDLPLYVFVDLNLPPMVDDDWNRWLAEIDTTMSDLAAEGYADSSPANIVFFSNDPSHYLSNERIGNDSDNLWIKYYLADSPRVKHPEADICGRFMKAHRQRVAPPADFPVFD